MLFAWFLTELMTTLMLFLCPIFAAGARFILIKDTSTTGNWVVFDTTRGIVAGNDPYLLLNSTAAEDTDEDAVDPANSGFIVNETSTSNINTNGVTYIYLAIA